MKQTAVEWLFEQISTSKYFYNLMEDINSRSTIAQSDIIEQAKEMEKEQINDACYEGYYQEGMYDTRAYYDKKYKKK